MSKLKSIRVEVPEPLWRRVKAAVGLSGLTMQQWVVDLLKRETEDRS